MNYKIIDEFNQMNLKIGSLILLGFNYYLLIISYHNNIK